MYGLNWNVVFAFLKSLFTINVTQYMKRKLSTCNTQCTKTASKMNTIGGWIIKGGSFSQHKPLTSSKLWLIWFLYLIQNQYSQSGLTLTSTYSFFIWQHFNIPLNYYNKLEDREKNRKKNRVVDCAVSYTINNIFLIHFHI